jgi:hypothetical protein
MVKTCAEREDEWRQFWQTPGFTEGINQVRLQVAHRGPDRAEGLQGEESSHDLSLST